MAFEKLRLTSVEWQEGARQINDCEYLFVRSIRELEELTLGLIVTEAKPQAAILTAKDDTALELLRIGARPIEEDPTCRAFELIFDRNHMISYLVLNESYGIYPKSPEEFIGKLFRVFAWSHLLEYTKRTTYASDENPGVLQHYEIACLNHVVDVISTKPPRISIGMWQDED